MAFLVLLEQLTPLERAVFLLRQVFDYEYAEIAEMVGNDERACRQLFSRAKKHIAENRPRFRATPEKHRQLLEQLMTAVGRGELDGLLALLSEDVTLWGWWWQSPWRGTPSCAWTRSRWTFCDRFLVSTHRSAGIAYRRGERRAIPAVERGGEMRFVVMISTDQISTFMRSALLETRIS